MENINFFALFLSFLFIDQVIEIYLSFRNRISIKNNRIEVPDDFKETISLKDHQKAADYQLTRIHFGFFFRIAFYHSQSSLLVRPNNKPNVVSHY